MIEYAISDDIELRLWNQWVGGDPWNPASLSQDNFRAYIQTKVPKGATVFKQSFSQWTIEFADPQDLTMFLLKWA